MKQFHEENTHRTGHRKVTLVQHSTNKNTFFNASENLRVARKACFFFFLGGIVGAGIAIIDVCSGALFDDFDGNQAILIFGQCFFFPGGMKQTRLER